MVSIPDLCVLYCFTLIMLLLPISFSLTHRLKIWADLWSVIATFLCHTYLLMQDGVVFLKSF